MASKSPKTSPPPAKTPEKSPEPAKSPTKSPSSPKSPSSAGAGASSGGILPADYWAAQDPPPEDDNESALGSSIRESTASLTSSILNYRTLHGRRFHSDVGNASYWGANDEKHTETMDMNHHAHTLLCGDKLFVAPIDGDNVKKVLDIGTGTGIWAIDFADSYPEAEVIGTDISPIQPTWIPPNLKFEIEDCTREWTYEPESFDFIHMRWLFGSIADWDALYAEAFKTVKPGGWVESSESSLQVESDHVEIPDNSALGQWGKFFIEGGERMGRTCKVVEEELQRKGMEAAGFVDIQVHEFKRPSGTWPKDKRYKEVGALSLLLWLRDAEGYILQLADVLGWTREEILVYIAHLRPDLKSGKYCPYYRQKVVIGRKPE